MATRVMSGAPHDHLEDMIDEAGEESFPASDPPAVTTSRDPRQGSGSRHPVLLRLDADHRGLRRLIALLQRQPSLLADPLAPHVALLVDALFYMTRFPDVTHHPLEDRITERLLSRRALDEDLGRELEAQHVRLARQGLDLLRDLEGAARAESISRELVAANIGLYVERLRHNMAFEELVLFPAAAQHLDDGDWRALSSDEDRLPPDPLFHAVVQDRFRQLHQAIVVEAGCDCET